VLQSSMRGFDDSVWEFDGLLWFDMFMWVAVGFDLIWGEVG